MGPLSTTAVDHALLDHLQNARQRATESELTCLVSGRDLFAAILIVPWQAGRLVAWFKEDSAADYTFFHTVEDFSYEISKAEHTHSLTNVLQAGVRRVWTQQCRLCRSWLL